VSGFELVALPLAAVGPLLALARLTRVPDTLLLFGSGVAAAFVPGLPPVRVDPQLVLVLFLPPILHAAMVRVSFHLLRFTLVSGVLFGVALSLATIAAAAALAARLLLPGLPWIAALLLGIVVAVFDTRLFHEAEGRPHVPRAVADALKTREMVSRVVVLASFSLALDALTEGPPSPAAALGTLAYELVGGAVAGAALGRAIVWLRERIDPAPVEIAVSIATPYLGAPAAQRLGLSSVVVIMAAALTVSAVRVDRRSGAPRTSSEARISAAAFWEELSLILSAVLFFLAGRALPEALRALGAWPAWWLVGAAAGLLAAVLGVQFAASLASTTAPSPAEELGTRREASRAVTAGVMAWASTRSVIGLVLALSIPASLPDGRPFAERDVILVVAALAIVGSVLLQGLTLRGAVRRAVLGDHGESEREERAAERAMAEATRGGRTDGFRAERRALLALRERNRIGATRCCGGCCARPTCGSARPRPARFRARGRQTPEPAGHRRKVTSPRATRSRSQPSAAPRRGGGAGPASSSSTCRTMASSSTSRGNALRSSTAAAAARSPGGALRTMGRATAQWSAFA
jgi:CPA1 family monovalent cation:H+ antiporter